MLRSEQRATGKWRLKSAEKPPISFAVKSKKQGFSLVSFAVKSKKQGLAWWYNNLCIR